MFIRIKKIVIRDEVPRFRGDAKPKRAECCAATSQLARFSAPPRHGRSEERVGPPPQDAAMQDAACATIAASRD
jgi:hypothetical protein